MINHDVIKRLAKEHKIPVKDLLALSPGNDPFYINDAGDTTKAEQQLIYSFGG